MAKGVTIDLIVDPKKAIEGLGEVEGKASNVSGTLGKLGGVAAAGVAALGTAAVSAVVGLASATKGAGEYAESVELAASKTHLTTDAVQELQYASKVTGVDFETISGSLTKLTKSMGAAEKGTGAQADAFKTLGVATTDANGNLRDSTVVYSETIAALGQVDNPAQRDILAMQLLGKSATELNPLIDGTAGSLTDLAAQAHEAGAVLSADDIAKLGGVDDALDKLTAGADAAKNALGLTLMPVLTELGDQGSGLLGKFTSAVLDADGDLSKAAPAIGAVFGEGVKFILGQVPKFLEVGTSIISALISGIATQAPTLIKEAIPVLAGFVTTILGQLPMLIDAGAKVLVALVEGIAAALPTLIPAAIQAIIGMVTALIDNLPLILDAGLQLIMGLVTGIVEAIPQLIAALPGIIVGIITFLINAIPTLIDAGLDLFLSLVGALPDIITGIVDAIPKIIVGLITAVVGAIPKLIAGGIKLFMGLIGALPQIIISLVSAMPLIIKGLVDAFTDPKTLKQLADAGVQLIQGLWQGIKGSGDWLWRQLSGFFGGIIKQIKGLMGIHSPSTLMEEEIGDPMGLGLAGGFINSLAAAKPKIMGAVRGVADAARGAVGGAVNVGVRATVTDAGALAANARATVASGGGATNGGGVEIHVHLNGVVGGHETGRAVVNAIQEYVRTGGTGLKAVLGG